MLLFLATLCAALAQEPPAPDAGLGTPASPYEVIVRGDKGVEAARKAAVQAIEDAGWRHVRTRHGADVFRGPFWWAGKVRLTDSGLLMFGGKPVQFGLDSVLGLGKPVPHGGDPFEALARSDQTPVVEMTVRTPSKAKMSPPRARLADAVEPQVRALRKAIQDASLQQRLQDLPGRLDALWSDGTPLEGTARLETPAARRGAVLAFWSSRTDTPSGHAVCAVIEQWLAEVVQGSTWPVTPAEQAAANAAATNGRHLDLDVAVSTGGSGDR